MIERKIIAEKKNEYAVKEYVKKILGKGKVSDIKIERTPIGERIIVHTTRPGLIIGSKGEAIQQLTETLKKQFKMENPKIEVSEIAHPDFDAKNVADQIAIALERFGPQSFKMRAYRALERIKNAGALGAEIVLSGKLPAEKARAWRFGYGYLKKTGEIDIVNKAQSTAKTKPGIVGIKVSIVPKDALIADKIEVEKFIMIKPEEVAEIKEELIEKEVKKKTRKKKKIEEVEVKKEKQEEVKTEQ